MGKRKNQQAAKESSGDKPSTDNQPEDLNEPVAYTFLGRGDQHIVGIPARDLTLEDYERLEEPSKAYLKANASGATPLYRKTDELKELQAERDRRRQRGLELATEANKSLQIDPNVPGRVDTDVLAPGLGVPPTKEPRTEGAPGFIQADTDPNTTIEEG